MMRPFESFFKTWRISVIIYILFEKTNHYFCCPYRGDSMSGSVLLAGGAEFRGEMAEPDLRAIALTGKQDPSIIIIPAAAAPDNNHERAGKNGVKWFQSLGVKNVRSLPVIDRASANDRNLSEIVAHADLVYLLGGFPEYLEKTLRNSLCWSAAQKAYHNGAVLAGSSAGAMVLCEWYFNPASKDIQPGLSLLPNMMVIPHHENTGSLWAEKIQAQLKKVVIAGIDEQTGIIRKPEKSLWEVFGKGAVTVYQDQTFRKYVPGSYGLTIL